MHTFLIVNSHSWKLPLSKKNPDSIYLGSIYFSEIQLDVDLGFIHNGPPPIFSVSQFPLLSFFAFSNCNIFLSSILYSILSAWPIHFKSKNFINLTISYLINFLIYFNVVPNSPNLSLFGPLILHKFSIQKYKMLRALKYSAVNVQDSAPYICYIWPN